MAGGRGGLSPTVIWRRTLLSPLHGKVENAPSQCQVPHWWRHWSAGGPCHRLVEALLPLLIQGCHLQTISTLFHSGTLKSLFPETHHIEHLYIFSHWDGPLRRFHVKLSNLCRDTGFACCSNPFCLFLGHTWIWMLSERTVIHISGKCFWQSSRYCSIHSSPWKARQALCL